MYSRTGYATVQDISDYGHIQALKRAAVPHPGAFTLLMILLSNVAGFVALTKTAMWPRLIS